MAGPAAGRAGHWDRGLVQGDSMCPFQNVGNLKRSRRNEGGHRNIQNAPPQRKTSRSVITAWVIPLCPNPLGAVEKLAFTHRSALPSLPPPPPLWQGLAPLLPFLSQKGSPFGRLLESNPILGQPPTAQLKAPQPPPGGLAQAHDLTAARPPWAVHRSSLLDRLQSHQGSEQSPMICKSEF